MNTRWMKHCIKRELVDHSVSGVRESQNLLKQFYTQTSVHFCFYLVPNCSDKRGSTVVLELNQKVSTS